MKCDETKPSCQRCMKFQGFCGGYESSAKKAQSKARGAAAAHLDSKAMAPIQSKVSLKRLADPTEFDNEYLHAWKRISCIVKGWVFPCSLYTNNMFQLGQQEPSIRHAVMALGNMHFAMEGADLSTESYMTIVRESPFFKNALNNYSRAIKLLQTSPSEVQARPTSDERAWRNVIMCCLLFITFEALNNNTSAVFWHINHGQYILGQLLKSLSGSENKSLMPQSPAPNVISYEVIQLFYRFDFHAWLISVIQPKKEPPGPVYVIEPEYADEMLRSMPRQFTNTTDAFTWFLVTQHYAMNFSRKLAVLRRPLVLEAKAKGLPIPLLCDVPNWTSLSTSYLSALDRWYEAFDRLYAKCRNEKDENLNAYLQVISLRMLYLWTYAAVASAAFTDYAKNREQEPLFKDILHLVEVLLPHMVSEDGMEPFTLDNGPVPALFICSTKSRDRETRRRALDLLAQYPRRDGLFDSRAIHAMATWSSRLEEEYEACGVPEEEHYHMLKCREAIFHEGEARCTFIALHRDPETLKWNERVDIVTW